MTPKEFAGDLEIDMRPDFLGSALWPVHLTLGADGKLIVGGLPRRVRAAIGTFAKGEPIKLVIAADCAASTYSVSRHGCGKETAWASPSRGMRGVADAV